MNFDDSLTKNEAQYNKDNALEVTSTGKSYVITPSENSIATSYWEEKKEAYEKAQAVREEREYDRVVVSLAINYKLLGKAQTPKIEVTDGFNDLGIKELNKEAIEVMEKIVSIWKESNSK